MQIIQKPDIVDKLRELGLQLTQKGKNWWACCPFHGEKTPSFAVNAEKQIFHCFGCGEHGDIITYVQKLMSLPFGETCRVLGMRDNIKRTKEEWRKYYEEQRQCLAEVEKKNRLVDEFRMWVRWYRQEMLGILYCAERICAAINKEEYLESQAVAEALYMRDIAHYTMVLLDDEESAMVIFKQSYDPYDAAYLKYKRDYENTQAMFDALRASLVSYVKKT